MSRYRKSVDEISDRAKRYRANRVRPAGPRRCAYPTRDNPCKGRLGVNHKDGDESNGARSNLNWACSRHNAQLSQWHKAHGKGVRTRQYNPGASNLAQYVQAAVEHSRGSHDAGGRVIHETPKSRRREFAREIAFRKTGRLNPGSGAEQLYRDFHGKEPARILSFQVENMDFGAHPDLTQLGELSSLTVGQGLKLVNVGTDDDVEYESEDLYADEHGWEITLCWRKGEFPQVAGVPPNGHQLYFIGGNQDISAMINRFPIDPTKELLDLGPCLLIEYQAAKKMDNYKLLPYVHGFGEDTGGFIGDNGKNPRLVFDQVRKVLGLVGGCYIVKKEGIVD